MKYKVPVIWQMYGHVTVEADTLKDAAEIAESDMGIGLPDNGEYIESSWEVDWHGLSAELATTISGRSVSED